MPFLAVFIPSAGQCFTVAGPALGIFGLVWLARNGEEIVHAIFPHWEWERQLGWLNLRANQRAEGALRWIGHLSHAGLLAVLAGILWNSWIIGTFDQWDDPAAVGYLLIHLSILLACVGIWAVYLTTVLAPKIRHDYERNELARFRREHPELVEEDRTFRPRGIGRITIWDSPLDTPNRR